MTWDEQPPTIGSGEAFKTKGGELCLWDERSTQHFATADHFPARREMARVAVGDPV